MKIVERKIKINDKRHIQFKVNSSVIVDSLHDNAVHLDAIRTIMNGVLFGDEFDVERISIVAAASPEGSSSHNERLSRLRADAMAEYLSDIYGGSLVTPFNVDSKGEDWETLRNLIVECTGLLSNQREILNIIDETTQLDTRENLIRNKFPDDYELMKAELYPLLRYISFEYDLSRRGMVQDTLQTYEIDTRYMKGVKLLQERNYYEAERLLEPYRDLNYALCLLSISKNNLAVEVLEELPPHSTIYYLKSIANARLGNKKQAKDCFLEAVNINPNLEYRGRLDPEISELLKIEP